MQPQIASCVATREEEVNHMLLITSTAQRCHHSHDQTRFSKISTNARMYEYTQYKNVCLPASFSIMRQSDTWMMLRIYPLKSSVIDKSILYPMFFNATSLETYQKIKRIFPDNGGNS